MSRITIVCLLFVALFAQVTLGEQKVCRALVLEAGGDLGSFEAGAIQALVDLLPDEEVQYDVMTGISIGSINALGISQFAKGQEKEMADWLVNLWKPLKRTDIYTNYKGGIIQGLLYETGLFNSENSRKLLKQVIKTQPKRKLNIGTCNLRTGAFKRYHEDLQVPDLIEAALASGSVPTFFPYSTFDGEIYVDGGTSGQLVDISGAINRCREIVDDDSQIIIDAIFVQYAKLNSWTADKKKKTIEVTTRAYNIQAYRDKYREIVEAIDQNPTVNFRHIILPRKALYSPTLPFLFNNKQMNEMINQGYEDASYQIKNSNSTQAYQDANLLLAKEHNVPETKVKRTEMLKKVAMYKKLKLHTL